MLIDGISLWLRAHFRMGWVIKITPSGLNITYTHASHSLSSSWIVCVLCAYDYIQISSVVYEFSCVGVSTTTSSVPTCRLLSVWHIFLFNEIPICTRVRARLATHSAPRTLSDVAVVVARRVRAETRVPSPRTAHKI